MILISHRGNVDGKNPELENSPDYILRAVELGYDVEVDVWSVNGQLYLGHDSPDYLVDFKWFFDRSHKLWIHCKNIESVEIFTITKNDLNYFWHQEDKITLTSKKYIWVYPGNQPIKNSIAVLPEMFNDDVEGCLGVCSDLIKNYK